MGLASKIRRRFYRYAIDIANNQEVRGWCFQALRPDSPVKLQFLAGEDLLGETVADLDRVDVKSRGAHPTGACGFHFRFPSELSPEQDKRLSVRAGLLNTEIYSSALSALPAVITGKLPRVLFMHIPKTAGTSFNTFARSYFPQARTITHIEARKSAKYSDLTEQYDFISGHLPLFTLRKHFDLDQLALFSRVCFK